MIRGKTHDGQRAARLALPRKIVAPELLESRTAPSGLTPLFYAGDWLGAVAACNGNLELSADVIGYLESLEGGQSPRDGRIHSISAGAASEDNFPGKLDATRAVGVSNQARERAERSHAPARRDAPMTSDMGLRAFSGFNQSTSGLGVALSGRPNASRSPDAPAGRPPQPYAAMGGSGGASDAQPSLGSASGGGGGAKMFAPLSQQLESAPAAALTMAEPLPPSSVDLLAPPGDAAESAEATMPEVITPVTAVIPPWPMSTNALPEASGQMAAPPLLAMASLVAPPVISFAAAPAALPPPPAPLTDPGQITDAEVAQLLARAAKATSRTDAIIAIVDRNGRILGVHVEGGVSIADEPTLVYAIDGAVAKARTAAFFSNDMAPLTSRTVRFISQSTITEREVESNPSSTDPLLRGPGFVAPIGLGGHFPPDVMNTPHVDLFAIEHTNRDSLVHPGDDRLRQPVALNPDGSVAAPMGDDVNLVTRFGATFIAGQEVDAPESYGFVSDRFTQAQSRGIATLPGGVPLYKIEPAGTAPRLVGGIGVFFPGANGDATFEQGFVPGIGQATAARTNAPLVLEAEFTAALVAANTTVISGMSPVPSFVLPEGRIDLVGITLESVGPHPMTRAQFLATPYAEGTLTGSQQRVTPDPGTLAVGGQDVPTGWLVAPQASSAPGGLTAAEVQAIIDQGVAEANLVRAAIRLPLGSRTRMVLSVTDLDGTVLALYRMADATVFSVDVAVAKARNVTYYASSSLKPADQVDSNDDGVADLPLGIAFTNRTFRYLAEPNFPSGIDTAPPGAFSTLRVNGVNGDTAENLTGMTPTAADFNGSVLGFDAFNPGSNFQQDVSSGGLQNGVVFFPGSTPLYRGTTLLGGLGVSGDGVDQDDVVTFVAAGGFLPRLDSPVVRADEVFVDGVRLPYQKFLRNPHG